MRSSGRNKLSPSGDFSEPNQVSTRLEVEKQAAMFSPKKKLEDADRIPATKRAIDVDNAEEQAMSKKRSLMKGRKLAEKTVQVYDVDDAGEEQTARGKESSSKGKKATEEVSASKRVWTGDEEIVIMHIYLDCAKKGLQSFPGLLPKVNQSLAHQITKVQLYEKLKSMRERYKSTKAKIARENLKEYSFPCTSLHEKELYKLWKHAWDRKLEEDERTVEAAGDATGSQAVGGELPQVRKNYITAGDPKTPKIVKDPKTSNTKKAIVSNNIPAKAPVLSRPMPNDKLEDRIFYVTIMKDILDVVNRGRKEILDDLTVDLKKMLGDITTDLKKMSETTRPN